MTDNTLHHIDNKPLREKVLDILREAIVSGEMKPGQPLVEMELATRLGISRAPLREALQVLSLEGLVEITPYRGAMVRNLTRSDIEELYSLRTVLEEFALRRVMATRKPDTVPILQSHFEGMLAAAADNNLREVNHIDRLFHDALITLSGHHLLEATWRTVSMRVRQVMALRNQRNSELAQVAYNHVPIIEAIRADEVDEAVRLLRAHIASSGDLMGELWGDDNTPSPRNLNNV